MSFRPRFTCALLILTLVAVSADAQIIPRNDDRQRLPSDRDSTQDVANSSLLRPDTVILLRYDPQFPVAYRGLTDSLLDLAYVRYDPVQAFGPDYVSLNSLAQPATLNPVLGTPYTRLRPTTQREHPGYLDPAAPYFEANVPFSYTAYDQGGEIDDGQFQGLFGRSFAEGWRLGFDYRNIYQGGTRNRYPESAADRVSLGATLAHVPDSSRHRSYAWIRLGSAGYSTSGGYLYPIEAEADDPTFPDDPGFLDPKFTGSRSEERHSNYHLLHRTFLRQQLDSAASGWSASVGADYGRGRTRHTANIPVDSAQLARFSEQHEGFLVDDRGLRYAFEESSLVGQANLEYFLDPRVDARFGFNFQAGVYAGQQRFAFETQSDSKQTLLGLSGKLAGEVLNDFSLNAEADIALGERAGQGKLLGSLGWTFREQFNLSAEALLERSEAPWSAERAFVNGELVADRSVPVSTHTRFGGSLLWVPTGILLRGYLDAYLDATVYGADQLARGSGTIAPIPTLELDAPVQLGPLVLANRAVARAQLSGRAVRLPSYTAQHSAYVDLRILKRRLNLMAGLDGWVRSPADLYDYSPLTGVFYLGDGAANRDWQFSADAFVAFKVQSFKAFVRLDNLLVNAPDDPPLTVRDYPEVRGGAKPLRTYLRFGVSFFLFN